MNAGKTLVAQVMEHVPWNKLSRAIERRKSHATVPARGWAAPRSVNVNAATRRSNPLSLREQGGSEGTF
jgi:hypothetical protein